MSEGSKDTAAKASAAAVGALVGTAIAGPAGAMVGAAAGPFLEPIMSRVWDELASDSRTSTEQVLIEASVHSGLTPEEFSDRISRDGTSRLLGGIAFSAGSRTRNKDKIRGLGRALSDGILADDDARIDETHLILRAIDDLETPHIAVLDLLVNYYQGAAYFDGRTDPPERVDPNRRAPDGGPIRPRWTQRDLDTARPGFHGSVPSLLGTLQRHGLAVAEQDIKKVLEQYQKDVRKAADSKSARPPRAEFKTRDLETRWKATDLGSHVLDYLLKEQADADHGPSAASTDR
jgi:hypothetical protein